MTFLLFAIGVGLVGLCGRLVARAIVIPRLQLKSHLRAIADYGFESPIAANTLSAGERIKVRFHASAVIIGRFMIRRLPSLKPLRAGELAAAGFYDATEEAVHGYRIMGAIGFPAVLLLLIAAGGKISPIEILALIISTAGGFVGPSAVIRRRGAARMDDMERDLPELIDLLIATVEAGIGFTAALGLIAERFQGALGDELRLSMKHQTLGITTQQALEEMSARCETKSIRAFVRTASRGETLGGSIGPVLRELSADQRRRRRQAARERMQKAPVKMIFPLMFLIMPALMIVLMYPAAYSLGKALPGT